MRGEPKNWPGELRLIEWPTEVIEWPTKLIDFNRPGQDEDEEPPKAKKEKVEQLKFNAMPTEIEGIKFYKVPEVAEALKVTPDTVRSWIKKGRMKSIRIGRPIYITEKSILEFFKEVK